MVLSVMPLLPEPSERACGEVGWGRWIPAMWHNLADPEGIHLWPPPDR
jgi:hypothetical protein